MLTESVYWFQLSAVEGRDSEGHAPALPRPRRCCRVEGAGTRDAGAVWWPLRITRSRRRAAGASARPAADGGARVLSVGAPPRLMRTAGVWQRLPMDFQSAMETFAEAWVAANTKGGGPLADVGCSQASLNINLISSLRPRTICIRTLPSEFRKSFL